VALQEGEVSANCKKCNDTGVIDTGNNDLPCDCPAGETTKFNVCGAGEVTGAEVKKHYLNDSPYPLSGPPLRSVPK
jgi:hypothetical protein